MSGAMTTAMRMTTDRCGLPDACDASMQPMTPTSGESAPSVIGQGLPVPERTRRDIARMRRALEVARTTPPEDVPIAAVVFAPDGTELAACTNRREVDCDPVGHAEVLALRAAAHRRGRWRLEDCELVVTVEPCPMCAGAIVGARVGRLVFGAYEEKTGACGSFLDVVRAPGALYVPDVVGGVLADEAGSLLKEFFLRWRGGERGHTLRDSDRG